MVFSTEHSDYTASFGRTSLSVGALLRRSEAGDVARSLHSTLRETIRIARFGESTVQRKFEFPVGTLILERTNR